MLEQCRETSVTNKSDGRMGTCATAEEMKMAEALHSEQWPFLVDWTPLGAGYTETCHNIFNLDPKNQNSNSYKVSHIRLNMGPDGGIARLKLYGSVYFDPRSLSYDQRIDLAALEHGGVAVSCSNKHYGQPSNLIAPGRGTCMGDGWETARQPRRPHIYQKGEDGLLVLPGSEWAILKLGAKHISSLRG